MLNHSFLSARELNRSGRLLVSAVLLVGLIASKAFGSDTAPALLDYTVVAQYPHHTSAFTQGLYWHQGTLYESSGLYGRSFVQQIKPGADTPLAKYQLGKGLFAEGITRVDNALYLLTWREQTLLKLDADTLQPISRLPYKGEGWGITFDGERFITSDGSSQLDFRNSKSFKPERSLQVTLNGQPLKHLNELEYIEGKIWANVWQESFIVIINPQTGVVEARLDLAALVKQNHTRARHTVLNGIAWDAGTRSLWVTGKLWPTLYRLQISTGHATNPPKARSNPGAL